MDDNKSANEQLSSEDQLNNNKIDEDTSEPPKLIPEINLFSEPTSSSAIHSEESAEQKRESHNSLEEEAGANTRGRKRKLLIGKEVSNANEMPDNTEPPVLPSTFEEERLLSSSNDPIAPGSDGDDDCEPPDLEAFQTVKKKRRPRRTQQGEFGENNAKARGEKVVGITRATCEQHQTYVKLFANEVDATDQGDCYATVLNGCLAYLLRKERIIQLLTSEEEIEMIREGGWMLDKPPRLPPLSVHRVCYAFYVDGSKIESVKELSNDDLKPWSSNGEQFGDPVMKPNVRRHAVNRVGGKYQVVGGDVRNARMILTEYSAWLPRLLRLRKKIYYLTRDGDIFGNVLILYDYTCAGEAPFVINSPHGNDQLKHASRQGGMDPSGYENPFEDNIINGPQGGMFLKVKPDKLGFSNNRKLLLRYLINEPQLLDGSNCMNQTTPFLPPLITTSGVFVYFVRSNFANNFIHNTGDGLSPWTTNPDAPPNSCPPKRVRSTKRGLRQLENGQFAIMNRGGWDEEQCFLVETVTVLARCPRLRKRVLYVQRNNILIGNVCYVYEYLTDGPIPSLNNKRMMITEMTSSDPKTSSDVLGEQFIDIEDLQVVEEEVIEDVDDLALQMDPIQMDEQNMTEELNGELVELVPEDTLNDGYDMEVFDEEDPLNFDQTPYYDLARSLESGHIYLTVRDKKLAASHQTVLNWISNTTVVDDRGLVNATKPGHPPIVRNNRAYAFFVGAPAIIPHDINRDDLSPWSHNGTENPTCYRTKVRKIGVVYDDNTSKFQVRDTAYKGCPFHLVYLYSTNPREPRLRKKVFYLMETEARIVVSHALFIYDYTQEGDLPLLHQGDLKRFGKKFARKPGIMHDIDNDVSDTSENEKDPIFGRPQVDSDGVVYMQLLDAEYWNNQNRQLHYLINKPSLVDGMRCLNSRVPSGPPPTSGKGAFAYFVNRQEMFDRNLTIDSLGPWSDNYSSTHGHAKRPKSFKVPLAFNRDGALRVWKTPATPFVEFQMHVYTATHPRCTRLRKKVVYVMKNLQPIGHALIMYWFTDYGDLPNSLEMLKTPQECLFQRLPAQVKDEIRNLLSTMSVEEVDKLVKERYGISLREKTLRDVKKRVMLKMERPRYLGWNADVLDGGDIEVANTEVIDDVDVLQTERKMSPEQESFLKQTTSSFMTRKGNTVWRIVKNSFGVLSEEETFDILFRMLLERDEARLLQNVNSSFGVEIIAGGDAMLDEEDEGILEEDIVEDRHGMVEEVIVEEEMGHQKDQTVEQMFLEEEVVMDDLHLEA